MLRLTCIQDMPEACKLDVQHGAAGRSFSIFSGGGPFPGHLRLKKSSPPGSVATLVPASAKAALSRHDFQDVPWSRMAIKDTVPGQG